MHTHPQLSSLSGPSRSHASKYLAFSFVILPFLGGFYFLLCIMSRQSMKKFPSQTAYFHIRL